MTPAAACARTFQTRTRLKMIGAVLVADCAVLIIPLASRAAIIDFGSTLRVGSTLNTNNLRYRGTNTPLPHKVVHTAHDGADTALWNIALPGANPAAPAAGQVVRVSLEGCAQPAKGGPPPLTLIHFQALSRLPGGAVKIELTSQPFEISVCGEHKANGLTVSTYRPTNLCVNKGNYVAFNDEGGYVQGFYRSGVPYQVIGASPSSTMDSFILANATNNDATLSPSIRAATHGFASNMHKELMLRATLATGQDAAPVCRSGIPGRIAVALDGARLRGPW